MRLIDADALLEDAAEVAEDYGDGYCEFGYSHKQIEEAPTIDPVKWIPTSRELPIPNNVYDDVLVYYLVQNEYGDMMVATFIRFPGGARVWQQMYQDGAIMEDIIAWMPLPMPWRGEEG